MAEAINYVPDPIPRPRRDYPSLDLGGGSGSGVQQVYEGRAPAPPDDPAQEAVDFPIGGGSLSQWSVSLQQWV